MRSSLKWAKRPLFLIGFLALTACQREETPVSTQAVVQVNEHQLSLKEFSVKLARRLKDLDAVAAKSPASIDGAKAEIIKDFITQSLILDWHRTEKNPVTEQDVDDEVNKLRAQYPDDLSFRRSLASEGVSFSEWRESMRHQLIQKKFFASLATKIKNPGDEEVKKYFEQNRDRYKKKERIYVRQILTDEESKAEQLKGELKKRSFSDLATKYSIAPENKNGGLIGWVEKGSLDFMDPLFSLPVNAVSKIIKSSFGFHIVKIEKKLSASNGSLDEERPGIIRELRAQREQAEFVAWLDGQLRSSKISKNDSLIKSLKVETRGPNE